MYTPIMPCALVLSAAGMFGAYQAGAWKALAGSFRPDLVVGASAGALNGWTIASGCPPDELCGIWADEACDLMHPRFPVLPWRGIFDPAPLYRQIDEFFARYRPRIPFATTLVEVPRLRQVYVTGDKMTQLHLRASCAIPLGYPPVRIDGKWYVDGGLLSTVPLWAAVQLGATSAVVVNALPFMPSRFLRTTVGAFRKIAAPPTRFPNLETIEIRPPRELGTVRDAVVWKKENALAWMAAGERDASALLRRIDSLKDSQPERFA